MSTTEMSLAKALRIATRITEQRGGKPADKEAVTRLIVELERRTVEGDAAWLALPDSVSGDAAPEGTPLADRIRALAMESTFRLNGWRETRAKLAEARAARSAGFAASTPGPRRLADGGE